MKEPLYFIQDLFCAVLRRYLMIHVTCGILSLKGRFIKKEKQIAAGYVALSMAFYVAANYLSAFTLLLYGDRRGMLESRRSILPLLLNISLLLVYCLYFYSGKKSKICYTVFTIYTLNELIMFTLHSLFVALLGGVSDILTKQVAEGNEFFLQNYWTIFEIYQFFWNLSFQMLLCLAFYYITKILKQNLIYENKELSRVQELFLAVPSAMGMSIGIMLRSIMYSYKDMDNQFLMDRYPETRLLIPLISGLCIFSIILSAVILRKLVESGEREMLVEIYQNRISDMEEHMKDVEHLYDGIRGMRHDMRNYLTDLGILLQRDERNCGDYGKEVQKYLDGLYLSMEELDMKCSTGNPVTDVVISRKMRRAQDGIPQDAQDSSEWGPGRHVGQNPNRRKIPFECNFIFPEGTGISAFDLSILLNNGLDNALEASEREDHPYIRLDSYQKGNMFFIEIRNAFSGRLMLDETGKNLITGKRDSSIHGLGIKNMKNCAEKYYGTLRWEVRNQEFLLAVMLQGKEK